MSMSREQLKEEITFQEERLKHWRSMAARPESTRNLMAKRMLPDYEKNIKELKTQLLITP